MPLWAIHHTPGIFSDEEKHQLASRITDHYERIGLPRFYVVTIFNETRPEDFYVGGEPTPVGVRILIDNIARHGTDKVSREQITRWIKRILHPYMEKHAGIALGVPRRRDQRGPLDDQRAGASPGRLRGRKGLGDSQRRVFILRHRSPDKLFGGRLGRDALNDVVDGGVLRANEASVGRPPGVGA